MRKKISLLVPLKNHKFRQLYIANFFSNVGNWIQVYATGLIVASLSGDPQVTSLSQTATQLPVFMFAIFGGIIADHVNKARYQLGINTYMAAVATLFVVISILNMHNYYYYILLTFCITCGGALKAPAWQAHMSTLISDTHIEAAATLHGMSYNLSSIIGPTIGFVVISSFGISALYLINALSFLYLIYIFYLTRNDVPYVDDKSSILRSFVDILSIIIKSKEFIRHSLFAAFIFIPISGYNALLPIFTVESGGDSVSILATMMACFGVGAVMSAFGVQKIRHLISRLTLISFCLIIFGIFYLIVSFGNFNLFTYIVCVVGGGAWAIIISTMNSHTQIMFPPQFRSRVIGVYTTIFYGALTVGSFSAGSFAKYYEVGAVFYYLGVFLISIGVIAIFRNLIMRVLSREVSST